MLILEKTTERQLDELATLFMKHNILNRKGIQFVQFVEYYWRQGKLEEAIN